MRTHAPAHARTGARAAGRAGRAPRAERRTPNAERPQSPYAACVIAQVRR
ncbi:hypothetical protein BURPS1710A_A2792 [Burkholderia pseudomallei 1710a]|uniref:Uncharacterized protein n=1 Tax=Burkholderia pseudomallei 1710a TaxID=320371 RepID=A0A0E1W6Z4_BURPE|nr:hypothetical protein BURPS1710A_A2792 [Burkholderia pseudomallei 1710a]